MHDFDKKMSKMEDICCMKERLVDSAKAELSKGTECVDTHEMGQVIDMIKDLAEAEADCMKACYYQAVCEAMMEDTDDGGTADLRFGYNANRYASGRYAPKGHGNFTRMGHHMPYEMVDDMDVTEYEKMLMDRGRMGYDGSMSQTGSRMRPSTRSGYGDAYDRYRDAKRHYTETKSPADKSEMDSHASRHLAEAEATMREIWKDADPALRTQMKKELSALLGEMN